MHWRIRLATAAMIALGAPMAPAVGAQEQSRPQPSAQEQSAPIDQETNDIFVLGSRPGSLEDGPLISEKFTGIATRTIAEKSALFTRCIKSPRLDLLHKIIDGPPQRSDTRFALDRLIRTNAACYPGYQNPAPDEPAYGSCNPQRVTPDLQQCRTMYDRGALLRQALRRFAPQLRLTPKQTNDPDVQARYNAREVPRNQYRYGDDREMFLLATCMVRLAPRLTSRLAVTEVDWMQQQQIEQSILRKTMPCLGGARALLVPPAVLRLYLDDAVYRWAVAAEGINSLLPAVASS